MKENLFQGPRQKVSFLSKKEMALPFLLEGLSGCDTWNYSDYYFTTDRNQQEDKGLTESGVAEVVVS